MALDVVKVSPWLLVNDKMEECVEVCIIEAYMLFLMTVPLALTMRDFNAVTE